MGKIGEPLNNKPWHPSSRQNQTLLFEAEERQREEQQRLEERQEELKQERARGWMPTLNKAAPAGRHRFHVQGLGHEHPRRGAAGAADEAALAFGRGACGGAGKGRARACCRNRPAAGGTEPEPERSAFIKDF